MNPTFKITMENGNCMEGVLFPEKAPDTVNNFIALANSHFYDGLVFHRVIKNFMIQGGCPFGSGEGGPGYCIKGEFIANGVENDLSHTPGTLSMARAYDPNSAGCQFFIMHGTAQRLDGQYAAFGRVTKGMEVVEAIACTATNELDRPLADQRIASITVDTHGIDYPAPTKMKDLYNEE